MWSYVMHGNYVKHTWISNIISDRAIGIGYCGPNVLILGNGKRLAILFLNDLVNGDDLVAFALNS